MLEMSLFSFAKGGETGIRTSVASSRVCLCFPLDTFGSILRKMGRYRADSDDHDHGQTG